MKSFSQTWIIKSEDEGKEIKNFLQDHGISRRAVTDIKFAGGEISVNGKEVNVRYPLCVHDELTVIFPDESVSEHVVIEDIPLSVIFEDEHIIVIDKPAFMNTIPSRQHPTGSVANALAGYFAKHHIRSGIHIVTRLDRNTSGLVLAAKHRHAHHLLSLLHQKQGLARMYQAFATGEVGKEGVVDAPIGRKSDSIIEREVRDDGKRAVTYYKRLALYDGFSHISLQLETGRTHQIRVHLAYLGHPLLGDDLYGGSLERMKRQALHCSMLQFTHPLKAERMEFTSPLPLDMIECLQMDN